MATIFWSLLLTLVSPLTSPNNFQAATTPAKVSFGQHFAQCQEAAFFAMDTKQIPFGSEMGSWVRNQNALGIPLSVNTIVLDPGHGGKDPGASGKYTKEKDIALKVALEVGRQINSLYPKVNVIYTRDDDTFIPLHERAALANSNAADLFISVHCNFIPRRSDVAGSETYVMGLHTAEYNLDVAKRENSSILLEKDYELNYGGFDPNSPEGHIILSMYQNAFLEQSILFAEQVESQFQVGTSRTSRGVKQAGFAVLKGTTMPSVLIETGYLSNKRDENYLASNQGQEQIASSIVNAFTAYKRQLEESSSTINAEVETISNSKVLVQKPVDLPTKARSREEIASAYDKGPLKFKVQMVAVSAPITTSSQNWRSVPFLVEIIREDGKLKYQATGFSTYEEAVTAKKELRELGFEEAFVVAYQNGDRLAMDLARDIEEYSKRMKTKK